MSPRRRSSVLWGVVGALSFLVLAQGYRLFVGPLGLDLPTAAGVALGVGVTSAGFTHALAARMRGNGRS